MKRKLTACILMLFILALVPSGLWATETDAKAPQLVISETVFEFEPVLENEYVIHHFTIQNKGTAELAITRVKSG